LLLGIAGAVLGTQCPAQGAPLGICPETGDGLITGSTAATVPPPVRAVDPKSPRALATREQVLTVPTASPATPEKDAATLSAHDLIEASHERLLLAQAKRPLFGGSAGADGDAGDGAGRTAAASPAQLSYAPASTPSYSPEPPVTVRAAAPSIRAEFGTAVPSTALPDETLSAPVEAAGVGGPLLPPLPEPEPLSLPLAGPDAGATPEIDAAEAPEAMPAVPAMRIGDSRVNVRSGPSTADARLFGLGPGEEVVATEAHAGWTKIEDTAGRVGWVLSELLAGTDAAAATETAATAAPAAAVALPDPPAADVSEGAAIRTVAGSGVSVRETPSNSGARLFALAAGEDVRVTGSDKGWLQIVDGRGRTGWAYSDFFAPAP
jgi:SH3-like domain-containing protein